MPAPRKKTRRSPRKAAAPVPLSEATPEQLDDPAAAQAEPDGRKRYIVDLLPRHAQYIDAMSAGDPTRNPGQCIEQLVREAMQAHKYRTGGADVASGDSFSGIAKNNKLG